MFNSITWNGVISQLARTFMNNSKDPKNWHKSFGNLMFMRGLDVYKEQDFTPLQDLSICDSDLDNIYRDSYELSGHERSATILSNSSHIHMPVEITLKKAIQLYRSRAYVHHYKGVAFQSSFETVRDT